jgi:hypothetical protein
MTMRRYRLAAPILLALCLVGLADCAPTTTATTAQAQIPAIEPGTARVWFVRGSDSPTGYVQAAAPMVYANGSPVASLPTQTSFFRDYPPGTYRFTVEPYGLPTAQAETLRLAPGTQTYLQVQWVASWETGYPEAGWGFGPNTFNILAMSPRVAQAYLPTLAYLGRR